MRKKTPNTKIVYMGRRFYLLSALLCAILFMQNKSYGIACGIVSIAVIIIGELSYGTRRRSVAKYLKDIAKHIDAATHSSLNSHPMPVVICDVNGEIVWANDKSEAMLNTSEIYNINLYKIMPSLPKVLTSSSKSGVSISFNSKYYSVFQSEMVSSGSKLRIFYFIDDSALKEIAIKYMQTRPVVGLVVVDGYDDIIQSADDSQRSKVVWEIDNMLTHWATELNGIIKKTDNDRYVFMVQSKYLKTLRTNKFSILEDMHSITIGNKHKITVSMGVGAAGDDYQANETLARKALEMATGRGGDQAVLHTAEAYEFFGGRTKTVERKANSRSRIFSSALISLIDNSENVLVMGHRFADLDAVGACIGVAAIAKSRNKRVNIVLDEYENLAKNLVNDFINSDEYKDIIIDKNLSETLVLSHTLLVVVDTHRQNYTENSELVKLCDKIVVIDHHRKSTDCIENTDILYQDPHASSTSEMVCELIFYMDQTKSPLLSKKESDALMAGMMLDTKNYTVNTGPRTFELAGYLRSLGAEPADIKQYFKNDMASYKVKLEIVGNSQILFDEYALSFTYPSVQDPNIKATASQAADELLGINGINASFVGVMIGESVHISARSMSNINVQIIMESISGGGHQNVPGAQLEQTTLEQAQEKVIAAIKKYNENK